MNTLLEGVASRVFEVPTGYDPERFASLIAEIDARVLSGEILPEFVLEGLQSILDGGLLARDFPVWKTLQFASHDVASYNAALRDIGCEKMCGYLARIPTLERMLFIGTELDLVLVSPQECGFAYKQVKLKTFYARAQQLGLLTAWLEVAIMLRLNYLDQQNGEWLTVSCGENVDPDYVGTHVRVGRGIGQPALEVKRIHRDDVVPADQKFVFIKPRREPSHE